MGRGRWMVGVVLGAGASRLLACSSDYGEDVAAPATSEGGASDGSAPDAAAPFDAAFSTPGRVECGDASCDLASSYCCISDQGGGVAGFACTSGDNGCQANRAKCDESADCAPGESCCATLSFGKFATVCDKKCSLTQSCRTDPECGAEKCVRQRCYGIVSLLCGKNPFCEAL